MEVGPEGTTFGSICRIGGLAFGAMHLFGFVCASLGFGEHWGLAMIASILIFLMYFGTEFLFHMHVESAENPLPMKCIEEETQQNLLHSSSNSIGGSDSGVERLEITEDVINATELGHTTPSTPLVTCSVANTQMRRRTGTLGDYLSGRLATIVSTATGILKYSITCWSMAGMLIFSSSIIPANSSTPQYAFTHLSTGLICTASLFAGVASMWSRNVAYACSGIFCALGTVICFFADSPIDSLQQPPTILYACGLPMAVSSLFLALYNSSCYSLIRPHLPASLRGKAWVVSTLALGAGAVCGYITSAVGVNGIKLQSLLYPLSDDPALMSIVARVWWLCGLACNIAGSLMDIRQMQRNPDSRWTRLAICVGTGIHLFIFNGMIYVFRKEPAYLWSLFESFTVSMGGQVLPSVGIGMCAAATLYKKPTMCRPLVTAVSTVLLGAVFIIFTTTSVITVRRLAMPARYSLDMCDFPPLQGNVPRDTKEVKESGFGIGFQNVPPMNNKPHSALWNDSGRSQAAKVVAKGNAPAASTEYEEYDNDVNISANIEMPIYTNGQIEGSGTLPSEPFSTTTTPELTTEFENCIKPTISELFAVCRTVLKENGVRRILIRHSPTKTWQIDLHTNAPSETGNPIENSDIQFNVSIRESQEVIKELLEDPINPSLSRSSAIYRGCIHEEGTSEMVVFAPYNVTNAVAFALPNEAASGKDVQAYIDDIPYEEVAQLAENVDAHCYDISNVLDRTCRVLSDFASRVVIAFRTEGARWSTAMAWRHEGHGQWDIHGCERSLAPTIKCQNGTEWEKVFVSEASQQMAGNDANSSPAGLCVVGGNNKTHSRLYVHVEDTILDIHVEAMPLSAQNGPSEKNSFKIREYE